MFYVRVQGRPAATQRVWGPLEAGEKDAAVLAMMCPGCFADFAPGEYVTLVVIGPGRDPEAQRKAAADQFYSAVAIPAHAACVGLPTEPR
jgi:hypothetical protein